MDGTSRFYAQITVLLMFMCFRLEGWISLAAAAKSSSGAFVETVNKPEDCQTFAAEGDLLSVRFTESRSSTDAELNNVKEAMVTLGDTGMLTGWNEALLGACAGEERRLIVPATLAYGGPGGLPPSLQSNVNITYVIYVVQIDKPVPDNPAIDNSVDFEEELTTVVVVTEEADLEDSNEDEDKEETVDKDKTQSGGGKTGADDNADRPSFIKVLQFAVIPVAVILVVVVIYYLYKLRHPHKRTTFYKGFTF